RPPRRRKHGRPLRCCRCCRSPRRRSAAPSRQGWQGTARDSPPHRTSARSRSGLRRASLRYGGQEGPPRSLPRKLGDPCSGAGARLLDERRLAPEDRQQLGQRPRVAWVKVERSLAEDAAREVEVAGGDSAPGGQRVEVGVAEGLRKGWE